MRYASLLVLVFSVTHSYMFSMKQFKETIIFKFLGKSDDKTPEKGYQTFNTASVEDNNKENNHITLEELEGTVFALYENHDTEKLKEMYLTHNLDPNQKVCNPRYKKSFFIPIEWAIKNDKIRFFKFLVERYNVPLQPDYIDLMFMREYSKYSEREICAQQCLVLKKLLEAKADLSKKADDNTIPLGRYLSTHWRIIEKDDPVIQLCCGEKVILYSKRYHFFSYLLKLAYDNREIDLFSPNNDPIPQLILVLKELCSGVIKRHGKNDGLEALKTIMATRTDSIGSPQQCLVRLDKSFSEHNELRELIFNTQEYLSKALELDNHK